MKNEAKKSSDARKVRRAIKLNWLTMAKCWISVSSRKHLFVGSSFFGSAKFEIYLMAFAVIVCKVEDNNYGLKVVV